MEIEHAASISNHLGEGPVWHQAEQRLYWVDAPSNSFLILDPSTGKIERHDVGRFAISIAFCNYGELLIATDSELAYWSPGSNTAEHIAPQDFHRPRKTGLSCAPGSLPAANRTRTFPPVDPEQISPARFIPLPRRPCPIDSGINRSTCQSFQGTLQ